MNYYWFNRLQKWLKKDHNTDVEKFLIKNLIKNFKKALYQGTLLRA